MTDHWIAETNFVLRRRDGTLTPVHMAIGAPRQLSPAEWSCGLSLKGVYDNLGPTIGGDAIQALALAWGLARSLLAELESAGGVLEFEIGGVVPLSAYFGEMQPARLDQATDISGIAPLFIVKDVAAALSFYRDRLGFDITFQGPDPDDIFFGIVQRGGAMIMIKDVGIDPLPNHTRDVKKGWARWDAYIHVPDPDALAAEYVSRNVELSQPLEDIDDGLRGFELQDTDGYVLFFGRPHT